VSEAPVLETFGSYRLVWLLCQGGMAELYLALRSGIEGFEKVVALKRILPSITQEPAFIGMFLDEARLAAKLDHPNIVRIYDLGEIDEQYFMAMEYLPGEDLRDIYRRARELRAHVPIDVACSVLHDAALALDFAHNLTDANGVAMSLVHRDVSPSNIIVTYHGATKLVDFGIAKARNSSVQTQAGSFKGKLPYSSPEALRGDGVDHRADIFGMGIVLWELLTNKRLFRRDNYAAIVHAVKHDPIPPPSTIRSEIGADLDQVVMRALERDRDRRFQTALEMQTALEGVLDHLSGHRTSRQIGQWLTGVFGETRANTKTSMAAGKNIASPVEGIMQPLRPLFQPRAWTKPPESTTPPPSRIEPTPPSIPSAVSDIDATPRPPGPLGIAMTAFAGAALLACALLVAVAFWYARKGAPLAAPSTPIVEPAAAISIQSDPAGAAIFLNGEPSGRVTPSTISGLPGGTRLTVRLDKVGYASRRDEVELRPGQKFEEKLTLNPVDPKGESGIDPSQ
jgi:serine/threonine-protein kinase